MNKKPITVSEAGQKGGTKTAERHGKEFYNKVEKALLLKKETKSHARIQNQKTQTV